jgi:hypothetical protein
LDFHGKFFLAGLNLVLEKDAGRIENGDDRHR